MSKQAEAAQLLVQHAETLTHVLSSQLERAALQADRCCRSDKSRSLPVALHAQSIITPPSSCSTLSDGANVHVLLTPRCCTPGTSSEALPMPPPLADVRRGQHRRIGLWLPQPLCLWPLCT